MPTSKSTASHPLRGSWPPTQILLRPSVERDDAEIEDLDLAKMGEDPLMYFLTPTPSSYGEDGDAMDFDMEFDAGIEDAKHPPQIVRSVSPSSLGGLSRPPPRPPTPPRSPATPDLEYDMSATPDEYDDYMEAAIGNRPSGALSLPRRLKDLASGKLKSHTKQGDSIDALLPLAPPHSSHASNRGRAVTRPGPKPIAASQGSGIWARRPRTTPSRLSPHAWREPSPDVWAIEEETLEELNSEMGDSVVEDGEMGGAAKARAVDIPAAKPKKKVRFVLPVEATGTGTR
ncbi:hypothetical protein MFIFM68171_05069 [Madurella fahalii]|uniref:Uncharacterized protein n=1 Tax=Madurella fahalii TaxID=1157608 RepID=A0ABQ0GAT1_9PEZI